jgi:hypothetical protein
MVAGYDVVRRWTGDPEETSKAADRSQWAPYVPIVGLLAVYLLVRSTIFGSVLREDQWTFDVPGAFSGAAGLGAADSLWAKFVRLHQHALQQVVAIPPAVPVAVAAGIVVAWLSAALRDSPVHAPRVWALGFGPLWYLVACLPLLVTYPSPRHLYRPMAGPCIAIACLADARAGGPGRRRLARIASAVVLVALTARLLARQNAIWRSAGEISTALSRELPAALDATPREALIIVWAPAGHHGAYLTTWMMPFALQPPFVPADLYSAARLIEIPYMYCCPVEHWWDRKRPILREVLAGEASGTVEVHRLEWDEQGRRFNRVSGRVPRGRLQDAVDGALGAPLDRAETIDPAAATRLVTALMDVAATGR